MHRMSLTMTDQQWEEMFKSVEEKRKMKVKYPHIKVQLVGEDGNAFAIIGKVLGALRRAGVLETECKAFQKEAMSGDYDHLLQTAMKWVEVS